MKNWACQLPGSELSSLLRVRNSILSKSVKLNLDLCRSVISIPKLGTTVAVDKDVYAAPVSHWNVKTLIVGTRDVPLTVS